MNKSVISWLEKSAKENPKKVVYTDYESSITFEEVNRKSKAIGSWLAKRQIDYRKKLGNSVLPVGVITGRHILTPVTYLGVARAGNFYAPMDPTVPENRLNQILEVANPNILIADHENMEKARKLKFNGEIVSLEDIIETEIDEDLLSCACEFITEQSPLYAIFTSGSSGKPKGVLTSHYSVMCYLDGLNQVINLNDKDVLGSQSPLDYIAAVRDIYLPLMTGCATHIIPTEQFAMPNIVIETLNKYKVTTLCWSAAGLEVMAKLNAFEENKPKYIRQVVFSGSILPGKYLRMWQNAIPNAIFINQYGPTETTASCTYHIVRELADDNTVLPIGKPYKHYSVMVLKDDDKVAEPDEEGEICISGPALALGYYGDWEMTEKSFVQNPLNSKYPEKIYKSGDLGKIDENGILWFLGRKDRQIKHMGHRIELDEVEIAAMRIDGVEECSAQYSKEREILYLFYSGEATSKEISIYFRGNMPPFMVPRRIKKLEKLPKLPNGKKNMQELKKMIK